MLTTKVMMRFILIQLVYLLYMLSQAAWGEVERTGSGLNTVVKTYYNYELAHKEKLSASKSEEKSPPYFFVIIYSRDMHKDMAKLKTLSENLSEFYTSIGASKVRNFSKVVNYLSKSSDFTSTARTLVRECAYEVFTEVGAAYLTKIKEKTILTLQKCKDNVRAFEKVFLGDSYLLFKLENEVPNVNNEMLMTYNGHLIATMAIIESIKYLFQNKIPDSAVTPFELPNIFKEVFENFNEYIQNRAEGLNTIVRISRTHEDLQSVQKSTPFVFPTEYSPYMLIIDYSQDILKHPEQLRKLGETFTRFYAELKETNYLLFFSRLSSQVNVGKNTKKPRVTELIQSCTNELLKELNALLLNEEKPTAKLQLKSCKARALEYQKHLLQQPFDTNHIERVKNNGKTLEWNSHIIATVSIIEAFKLIINFETPTIPIRGLTPLPVFFDLFDKLTPESLKVNEIPESPETNRKRKSTNDNPLPKRV